MRRIAFMVLVLLLLVGSATALDPVNVAVKSSSEWIVANQMDSVMVTVTVTDGASKAIADAAVTLTITEPWTLENTQGITNGAGVFTTWLLPTKKSGSADIMVSVEVKGVTPVPVIQTFTQNISHDTPANQAKSYPSSATVGSTTEISILVKDKHGNPVDSRRKVNQVTFMTTLSGTGGFVAKGAVKKDKVKGLSVSLNNHGSAATDFILDTKPGPNFITIDPPDPLPTTMINIQGTPDEKPTTITLTVDPEGNPPTLTTDETSVFILEYQLSDQYGNPSAHQDLSVSTNAGENLVISSNSEGSATVTYGPKLIAGQYTVTATAVENPVVTVMRILRFASDDPSDMLLTASPQSMPSLEVNEDAVSRVMAKVIDTVGNPVQGQTVTFSILSVSAGASQTADPWIESGKKKTSVPGVELTAVTDENGVATVDFYPGTFAANSGMADGIVKIRAVWSTVTRDLDLSYKNYPYLSVSTSVDPVTVEVGEEVNVSIRLRGDGYALIPKPVDVIMLNDRSGSMLSDYPDRMVEEMNAATLFSGEFEYTSDRLGMLSFGTNGKANAKNNENCGKDGDSSDDASYAKAYYKSDGKSYGDWAVLDLGLSSNANTIKNAISGLVPSGYTPMRYALLKGITEMKKSGRSEAVRALVVMSDGDYNRFGDPLARGSAGSTDPNDYNDLDPDYVPFSGLPSQSMADYAKENSIRIYTIGYAEDISTGGKQTLEQLATQTGGMYFYAATGSDLEEVYKKIAGDLKEAAGVNTKMELDFQNVEVNGKPLPGDQVFDYVYRLKQSTFFVPPPPKSPWTENSEAQWSLGMLNFDLGTIKVNDEWVVNFTLKVLEGGNILVLGDNSKVVFDEGKGTLTMPDTYLTSIPEGKQGGLGTLKLVIEGLEITNPGDREKANLQWAISYNGKDEYIKEEIEVAPLNSMSYGLKGTIYTAGDATSETFVLDISKLEPGTYKVRVTGYVTDAEPDSDERELFIGVVMQTPMILIQ